MKRVVLWASVALLLAVPLAAQISVPNTLVSGARIIAGDLNTNFSAIANAALNRVTGGNLQGNITADASVTIDGVDIGATVCTTCAPTFKDLTLASPTTGLTVAGVNVINSSGKLPALSSTYLASLSGANLTGILTSALSGNVAMANLANGTFTVVTSTTTSNQNNWAPGLVGNTVVFWSGAGDITVTGVAGGVSGQLFTFVNTGSNVATFAHQSGSSSAGNKFRNLATSAGTPVAAGGQATWQYDGTDWRLVAHEQGAAITPTFAAGDFTADTAGTWTVASGDAVEVNYILSGRRLFVNLVLNTTTVAQSGGNPTALAIANGQWGGFTMTNGWVAATYIIDNGTGKSAYLIGAEGGTAIKAGLDNAAQFANATDTTAVYVHVTIEVT